MEKYSLRPCPFCGDRGEISQRESIKSVGSCKEKEIALQMFSEAKENSIDANMTFNHRQRRWYIWKKVPLYVPRCSNKSCIARQSSKGFYIVDDAITAWNGGKRNV